MIVLTAVLTGVCVYFLAGVASGNLPELRLGAVRRRKIGSSRRTWLAQAGLQVSPRQFVAGSVAGAVVTFLLVVVVTGTPVVALVPAIAAGFVPRAYFARRRTVRLREVQEAWPDGIRDLLASISAGMSLNRAIASLSRTGPAPLRRAFRRYPQLAQVVGVVPALEAIKQELADPTSDRVIEVLILAHERGGHILSEVLGDLAAAATRDLRAQEEIATSGLEQRINARAVFVLPWLVLVVLTLQPGPFRDFYQSAAGAAVVAAGGVLSLLGMWLVGRLSRQPVEDRVFHAVAVPGPDRGEHR